VQYFEREPEGQPESIYIVRVSAQFHYATVTRLTYSLATGIVAQLFLPFGVDIKSVECTGQQRMLMGARSKQRLSVTGWPRWTGQLCNHKSFDSVQENPLYGVYSLMNASAEAGISSGSDPRRLLSLSAGVGR
jgi:hypothetical protein